MAVEPEIVHHISTSELQIPVPNIEKHYSRTILGGSGDVGATTLEVENYVQSGSLQLHKLKLSKGGDTEWEQILSSKILAVAGTR